MKQTLLLSLFLFAAITCLTAKGEPQYPIADIPLELLKNAHTVVRNEQYEIDITSIRDYEVKHYYAVTLLSDKSTASLYQDAYDKHSKITKLKAKIFDANGKLVREIKKNEIKDVSAVSSSSIYEDDRIKYIDVSYKQYPYTIVFECSKSYKGTLSYPNWVIQEMYVSVQNALLKVRVAKGLDIQYKVKNASIDSLVQGKNGAKVYRFQALNLPAKTHEICRPSDDLVLPMVLISPFRFQYDGFIGDMSSWEAYSRSMYELNKGRDMLSPAMQKVVHSLTANLESTRQKIDTLYRYLQNNMRYVSVQLGIGGWQTFDAAYVEKNKYGDCKALSNFMKAMLKEAGITSYQALIYSDNKRLSYDSAFVNPRFNHVILYIPEEDYWLECTSNDAPPNYLGSHGENRTVLPLKEENGKLLRTPALGGNGNRQISQVNVALQADGHAKVYSTIIGKGSRQDALRYFSSLSDKDLRRYLRHYDYLPNGEIEAVNVKSDHGKPSATLKYKMSVPHYAAKAGKRLFVPINPYNIYDEGVSMDKNRQYPFVVEDYFSEEDVYVVDLPESFELESNAGKLESIDGPFGFYELNLEIRGRQLVCTRKLEIRPVEVPVERFAEVRDFYNQVIKNDKSKMVLVKKKT